MSKALSRRAELPFFAPDISALARSLRDQLPAAAGNPGHVEMLNMLARSVGFRNFQNLRAQHNAQQHAQERLRTAETASSVCAATVDWKRIETLARHFDRQGRLARWPSKLNLQRSCLWVLWSRLPPRDGLTEREVNETLRSLHDFGDHVLLRRELVNLRLLGRVNDGSKYWRIEQSPPADALALIKHLKARVQEPKTHNQEHK